MCVGAVTASIWVLAMDSRRLCERERERDARCGMGRGKQLNLKRQICHLLIMLVTVRYRISSFIRYKIIHHFTTPCSSPGAVKMPVCHVWSQRLHLFLRFFPSLSTLFIRYRNVTSVLRASNASRATWCAPLQCPLFIFHCKCNITKQKKILKMLLLLCIIITSSSSSIHHIFFPLSTNRVPFKIVLSFVCVSECWVCVGKINLRMETYISFPLIFVSWKSIHSFIHSLYFSLMINQKQHKIFSFPEIIIAQADIKAN